MIPVPDVRNLRPLSEQPVEFVDVVAGLYFRSIILEKVGDAVPQHSHRYDHATLVGSGRARLWVDGEWSGDFKAGVAIEIKAARQHVFQALLPNTLLVCVHDAVSAESLKGG